MVLVSYCGIMFRFFLDHLQDNVHMHKVQSVRTVCCGVQYYLQGEGEIN